MHKFTHILIACILVMLTVSLSYAAENTAELINNPFTQPEFLSSEKNSSFVANTAKGYALDIRATIADGEDSLVNVGGTIIKIGEELNGFKLMSVTEDKVVFSKNNALVTVIMDHTWTGN